MAGRLRPDEPVRAEEPVRAREPVVAPEPPRAPEPARIPEPHRATWPAAEPTPGTIGWLWPDDAEGGAGRGYRPPGRWTASGRWRHRTATLIAAGAVVLAAGGLVVGMSLHSTPAGDGKSQAGAHPPTVKGSATPTTAPTHNASPAAAPRPPAGEVVRASAWITHQVSADAIVACDLEICNTLNAGGFPAGREVRMGTNSQSLSNAGIVVVTPDLRLLFSTVPSLGHDVTPAVLASFGSGGARITVQVVYPGGLAAYQSALSQSVKDRIDVGAQLLSSGYVTAAPAVKGELAAGQVDPRLLLVLRALIGQQPIDIVGFADSGPGADPGAPFRVVELATRDQQSSLGSGYMTWMGSVLLHPNSQYPAIRPWLATLPDGQQVAVIKYAAPSPLGLVSGG